MSFTNKPIILCDVSGTLISSGMPNKELIALLNRMEEQGFHVQIYSTIAGTRDWKEGFENSLLLFGLSKTIVAGAISKDRWEAANLPGVVTIIDDSPNESYIAAVKKVNPEVEVFHPRMLDKLRAFLETILPNRGGGVTASGNEGNTTITQMGPNSIRLAEERQKSSELGRTSRPRV